MKYKQAIKKIVSIIPEDKDIRISEYQNRIEIFFYTRKKKK